MCVFADGVCEETRWAAALLDVVLHVDAAK